MTTTDYLSSDTSRLSRHLYWAYGQLSEPIYRVIEFITRCRNPLDPTKYDHHSKPVELAYRALVPLMALAGASRFSFRQLSMGAGCGIAFEIGVLLLHRVACSYQSEKFIHVKGNIQPRNIDNPKIATWNIFGFPAGGNYSYGGCTPFCDRFEGIVRTIREQKPDILVLQECIDAKIPEWLIKEFKGDYAHFFIHNGPEKQALESGLMILTRCPVESYDFIPFTDNVFGMQRGFAAMKIRASGKEYVIIGTHLISGQPQVRQKQLQQIHEYAKKQECEAVIFAGDTNIHSNSEKEVAESNMNQVLSYYDTEPTCTNTFRLRPEERDPAQETIDQIAIVRSDVKSKEDVISQPIIVPGYENSSKTARSDHHMLVATIRTY